MSAAPVWVSDDLKVGREHVRWFPALVSNHVVDLVSRYKPEELPPALTSYIRDRGQYDYLHHCEVDSSNADFVSDEVTDRFCLLGPAEAHIEKLRTPRPRGSHSVQYLPDVRRRRGHAGEIQERSPPGFPEVSVQSNFVTAPLPGN